MPAPLNVWSMLYYLTEIEGITWRQGDWTANKIVKALKGEPINKYFEITFRDGKKARFDQSNVATFLPIVFRAVAEKLKEELATPFDIVAIPNSDATIKDNADCRIFEHARAIASAAGNGVQAVPALRWKREDADPQGWRQPRSGGAL